MERKSSGRAPSKKIKQKVIDLKDWIQSPRYNINDIWEVCPFSQNLIFSDTKLPANPTIWRHLAVVWIFVEQQSEVEVAEYFGLNHSSVIYAIDRVMDSFIWKNDHTKKYQTAIKEIKEFIEWSETVKLDCRDSNEFISALLLENSIKDRI